jgi:hypothetical protein
MLLLCEGQTKTAFWPRYWNCRDVIWTLYESTWDMKRRDCDAKRHNGAGVTRQCLFECVASGWNNTCPNYSVRWNSCNGCSIVRRIIFEPVLVADLRFPCRQKFQPTLQALTPSNTALYRILLTLSGISVSLKSLVDGGYRRWGYNESFQY